MEKSKQQGQYRWAVGPYQAKAGLVSQADQKDPEMTLVWIPTSTLMRLTDRDQKRTIDPAKIERAVAFWQEGGFMEPPVVSLYDQSIVFADGRHRTLAAHSLGIRHIPVVVPKEETQGFRSLISGSSQRGGR